ncbi:CotO family spore coat protein [Bacillus salinus]|uniref:CotO family spore coat protein n=1 Tax=Bacillus sp. HMF5848 TaxID=2495421 RepID=UPI001639E9DC|nr:CotO family spore coat protein [Bacillus sp. HMF5848]
MKPKRTTPPFLYITQPTLPVSDAHMQRVYYKKQQSQADETEPITEEKSSEEIRETKPKLSPSKKAFEDMASLDKIDFLLDVPFFLPKSACEIVTKDGRYKGIVSNHDATTGFVKIETAEKPVVISTQDIIQIRVLN